MRKFGGFPICINYNFHQQRRSWNKSVEMHKAGRYQQEKELSINTYKSSDSTLESNMYQQEIKQWEDTVSGMLQDVFSNPVGRTVMGLINKSTTVWIVPMVDPPNQKSCNCAQTGPLDYVIQPGGSVATGVGFGDTVIQFRPELGDETLLHELVHAYRYSRKKFDPQIIDIYKDGHSDTENTEELLAHQMENIYLSQTSQKLTLDYQWDEDADKDTIYDFLVGNLEILQTLKYFLRHEYLAMLAAHSFSANYNPFRDYAALEARYLSGDNSLSTIPELGTILSN